MNNVEITLDTDAGGRSTLITVAAATSTQGPIIALPTNWPPGVPVPCIFVPSASMYVRKGANPTAVNDGTDMYVVAGNQYRTQLLVGERLAFINTAGGTVNFTPLA